MYLPNTMPPKIVSFLPSTCLSILDHLNDAHVEREHSRLKHFIVNIKKTRSKESTSSKRDQLKQLLLNCCVEAASTKAEEECSIIEAILNLTETIKTHISSQRQPAEEQYKPVATVTRDASTSPETSHISAALRYMSTSTSDLEIELTKYGVAIPGLIAMPTTTDKPTSSPAAASNPARATSSSAGKPSSPATAVEPLSASVLSCPKVCVMLDDIHSCTQFSKLRSRELCFYSKTPFKFGRSRHSANPYPNPVPAFLTNVANALKTVDKDFSLEHYSCMIEKY